MRLVENWLKKHGYYKFSDLQAGGHCGLCGKWIAHEILPKEHPITICSTCLEEKCEVHSMDNVMRKTIFE